MQNDICSLKIKEEVVCRIIRVKNTFAWVTPVKFLERINVSEVPVRTAEYGFSSLIDVQRAAMMFLKQNGINLTELKCHNIQRWQEDARKTKIINRNKRLRPPPILLSYHQERAAKRH